MRPSEGSIGTFTFGVDWRARPPSRQATAGRHRTDAISPRHSKHSARNAKIVTSQTFGSDFRPSVGLLDDCAFEPPSIQHRAGSGTANSQVSMQPSVFMPIQN